jgi:predicted transcriptional regulator
MKNEKLSADEYDALKEVSRGLKLGERISACIGRNTKRLSGLKMFSIARNGHITLTEKGQQALFLRRCVLGLRAVAEGGDVKLDSEVATFLGKKAHIVPREAGGYDITDKGRESLADIEAQGI